VSAPTAFAPRTALIVGAGIGGLSAGIALKRAGWNVRIFERATSPRELGFGVALAPNALKALTELGVAETVVARSFAPEHARGELRRMNGTVLKRAEFPTRALLSGPMIVALRPALHGALLDAVGEDSLTLASEATGFTQNADGVTLHLVDGQAARGDILVGADGAGSAIRRALHPSEPPPRSCGIVAVRGAVHGAVEHLRGLWAIYYLGRGTESMIVRASETGIYWFLSIARELAAGHSDPRTLLAHLAPQFDETFRAVTSATDDLRFDELVDRDPIPFWSKGTVTLLGDAAHPLLPHTGQGAAQAIVDAVTLGKTFTMRTDIAERLRAYEEERRPKTTTLLAQGRRTARVMRMTNLFGCALRDLAIQMMPIKTFVKLFVRINRRAGTDSR
jgi:2-polyprenyl-6-methoxyphenol hydroxylase-like FAD-dependent oxidoreductase